MGLDVYLKKCADRGYAHKQEERYEAYFEAVDTYCKSKAVSSDDIYANGGHGFYSKSEMQKQLGINPATWHHESISRIENDSMLYPEHVFKIGYMRSSYNDGGINNYLRRMGVNDLYYVFNYNNTEYNCTPDWNQARIRVDEVIDAYKEARAKLGNIDVMHLSLHEAAALESGYDALQLYMQHRGNRTDIDSIASYSCRDGEFFMNGLKVKAILPGGHGYFNTDTVYVVYERSDTDTQDWYMQALEIVREMLDWVLAQPDVADYYLSWSS